MKRKPGIPLIAMIIFFALIIGIIVTCIIILSTQSGKTSQNNIQLSSNSSGNTNINNDNAVMRNAIVDNSGDDEEETGEEIELSDSLVSNAFKFVNNEKSFAKYDIYKSGDFSNSFTDEMKIRIALTRVKDSEINVENNLKTISKTVVDKYIEEIFGSSTGIRYIDIELFNDKNFSDHYNVDRYVYDSDKEVYEIAESGINENNPPLVNDIIEKAVKYNNKLELYVIPLFVNTYPIDGNGMAYQLYGNYDFSNKKFDNELFLSEGDALLAVTADTFKESILSNNSADGYNYDNLKSNVKDFDQLQRYKYVFKKDSNSGKYYLDSFSKVNEESNNNNNNNNSNSSGNRNNNTNTNSNTNNNNN